MTWRLVFGVIALQRRSLLSTLVMVTLFGRANSMPGWLVGGLPLLFVTATGLTAISALSQRALVVLPLGPRELNRATWLLAVVLPLALLTIGRSLAGSVDALIAEQWSWVYPASPVRVFYECLFLALVGVWAVGAPDRLQPDFRADPGLWLKASAMLGVAVVPFLATPMLPSTFGAITPLGWLVTLVIAALASLPLLRTPTQYRRPTPPVVDVVDHAASAGRSSSTVPIAPRARRLDSLHGLWRLLPGLLGLASVWVGLILALMIVVQFNSPRATIWTPFDPALTELRFLLTVCIPLLFLVGLFPGLGSWLRRLRNLPLSRTEISAIVSAVPALTPILYWFALVGIHTVTTGARPDILRLGYLVTFVGIAAFVDAVGIRTGSFMARFAIGATLLLAFEFVSDREQAIVDAALAQWVTPLSGITCLAAAFLVNLVTVSRSTASARAYRFGRLSQGAR